MIRYYKNILACIILLVFPVLSGCGTGGHPGASRVPGYYAYSIRYGVEGGEDQAYLTKIDIRDDAIAKEVKIDSGYSNMSIEHDGSVLVSKFREGIYHMRTVSR